jgi:hypothetical protein
VESSLSIPKAELESLTGDFLGYGYGLAQGDVEWDRQQTLNIKQVRKSGERWFYYPEPVSGGEPYSWSFLVPTSTLTFATDAQTVALPDDFDRIEGDVYPSLTDSLGYEPVKVTGEGRVQRAYTADQTRTGRPELLSVRPLKGTRANAGQRFELFIFPAADQDYTLTLRYHILPSALTDDRPYAYGGAAHAETLKAACLAAAELFLDNERGPMYAHFQARLLASIQIDQRHRPQHLGYNGDQSDGRDVRGWRWQRLDEPLVTFNGIDPSS